MLRYSCKTVINTHEAGDNYVPFARWIELMDDIFVVKKHNVFD
tara:strand:+ start:3490 stop:3618 length:129 start_codon:yes stop_codon:yes gene_type:complete